MAPLAPIPSRTVAAILDHLEAARAPLDWPISLRLVVEHLIDPRKLGLVRWGDFDPPDVRALDLGDHTYLLSAGTAALVREHYGRRMDASKLVLSGATEAHSNRLRGWIGEPPTIPPEMRYAHVATREEKYIVYKVGSQLAFTNCPPGYAHESCLRRAITMCTDELGLAPVSLLAHVRAGVPWRER